MRRLKVGARSNSLYFGFQRFQHHFYTRSKHATDVSNLKLFSFHLQRLYDSAGNQSEFSATFQDDSFGNWIFFLRCFHNIFAETGDALIGDGWGVTRCGKVVGGRHVEIVTGEFGQSSLWAAAI